MMRQVKILLILVAFIFGAPDPEDFDLIDCNVREIAYEKFKLDPVYDALRLSACKIARKSKERRVWKEKLPKADGWVFVDPVNGDDSQSGTQQRPFKTIQAALDLAVKQKHNDDSMGVYLSPGHYRLTQPLLLDERHSNLILHGGSGPDVTTISGLLALETKWEPTKFNSKVYQTSLPAGQCSFNSLFVNGTRQVRARFPNGNPQEISGLCFSKANYADVEKCNWMEISKSGPMTDGGIAEGVNFPDAHKASGQSQSWSIVQPPEHLRSIFPENITTAWASPFSRPSSFTVKTQGPFDSISNPEKMVVHALHGQLWGGWQYLVENVTSSGNETTFNLQYGGWQEARGANSGKNMYVENALELLDEPGEWYVNEDSCVLYFYPNSSNDLSNEVEAAIIPNLIKISGKVPSNALNIQISGIQFTGNFHEFIRHTVAYDV